MAKSATRAKVRAPRDEEERPTGPTIKVRAIAVGYYNDARRRVGDVFVLYPRRGTFSEEVLDKDGEVKIVEGIGLATRETREVVKTLSAEDQFSDTWMERVADDTPERTTGPNQDLRAKHDEEMRARSAGGPSQTAKSVRPGNADDPPATPTGGGDPLGD